MPVRWIALGAGAYLASAIALFPAEVAHRWFAPDGFRLSGVQGTVWSGSAALGSAGPLGFHGIRWQVRPWTALLARPGGSFEAGLGDGFLQADVRVGPGAVSLTEVRASCSLSALASALPIAGIRGQVSLELAELTVRDGWPASAEGQLRLGRIMVPPLVGSDPIVLGNYDVTLSGGDGLQGLFEDRGGPLQVRGSASLSAAGQYEIGGVVRARPEANAALTRGVELLTRDPDDAGLRAFSFAGTL